MASERSFTIDKVGWHTQRPGNTETRPAIHRRFRILAAFLQENGLTVRRLLSEGQEIDDEFAISTSDLTDEG